MPDTKTRVLFLNTRSALGADVAVHLSLIQNFDPAQVEVHVATNRHSVDLAQTLSILATVPGLHPLVLDLGQEISQSRRGKLGKLAGAANNLRALPSLAKLAFYIRKHRISLIHATDRPRDALFSLLLAQFANCRSVIHVHIKWNADIGRAAQWSVDRCAGMIAISQFVRDSMRAGGVPEAKIHTCLNATDPARFDPARVEKGRLRRSMNLAPDTLVIGLVARVIIWKGHLELVEAMARVKAEVPHVHLVIVGVPSSGPFPTQIRQRITELGLDDCVSWAGWRDDAPEVMADLDVLAVPSYEEPFGLVVTEGMAMQCPIVSYDSGALPEIVTDGVEGLLVPPHDIAALADALISLLRDPARRAHMGCQGRARVFRDFTPQRQANEMAAIYRKIRGVTESPTP